MRQESENRRAQSCLGRAEGLIKDWSRAGVFKISIYLDRVSLGKASLVQNAGIGGVCSTPGTGPFPRYPVQCPGHRSFKTDLRESSEHSGSRIWVISSAPLAVV